MIKEHKCVNLSWLVICFCFFREDWFGVLFSQTASSKKSNLVLGVFYPGTSLSWLGRVLYLGNHPENTDPRLQQAAEKEKGAMYPLPPPRPLSFQTPNNFLWAEEGVLQSDITKVIRYSRKLPEKESSLVKVCVCVCVCV